MAETAAAAAPPKKPSLPLGRWAQLVVFAVALVLALLFVFGRDARGVRRLVPDKWLNQDGTFYYVTLRTLVDRHTLIQDEVQPRSWYEQDLRWNTNLGPDWSNVAVGRDGHYFPKHPILMPIVTIPFYLAFGSYGPLLFNLLCLALLPVVTYRLARHLVPWIPAAAAALLFGTSAYLTGQAYGYSNDIFTGLLVALAFERALAGRSTASGVVWGLSVFAKATDALVAPGLALIPILKKDWAGLKRMAIGAVPGCAIYAALNTWMYGAPWHTGYNHILHRQNNAPAYHDVSADFDWGHYGTHLVDVLWHPGQFGMHDRFFLWVVLVGPAAVVALIRAPRLAAPLLLGALGPVLMLAPFKWFRVEFLDGTVALSVPLIAALLMPWAKPPVGDSEPPSRVRWSRLVPVVSLVILLVSGAVRAATESRGDYFDQHLGYAHNFLANIPCDYFNWQSQRWECSNYDQGRDDWMTGRTLGEAPRFGGHPEELLAIAPHPSRQPRSLVYEGVPLGSAIELRYGLRDGTSARGQLHFSVAINGQSRELALGPAGELRTQSIDTSTWRGQLGTVTFTVQSDTPGDPPIYFDGAPH